MQQYYKRYCKVLRIKNDPELIEKYKEVHGIGKPWPEITRGMKEIGILDMEIYIHDNILFMIMDTVEDFDHEKAMAILAKKPRQAEWEKYVSEFQVASRDASAAEKWQLTERVYEMDQKFSYSAGDGQLKKIKA